jgi:hypothetical protein
VARTKNNNQKKSNNGANVGYEAELWQMADTGGVMAATR